MFLISCVLLLILLCTDSSLAIRGPQLDIVVWIRCDQRQLTLSLLNTFSISIHISFFDAVLLVTSSKYVCSVKKMILTFHFLTFLSRLQLNNLYSDRKVSEG